MMCCTVTSRSLSLLIMVVMKDPLKHHFFAAKRHSAVLAQPALDEFLSIQTMGIKKYMFQNERIYLYIPILPLF